jgi:hypothetical protein
VLDCRGSWACDAEERQDAGGVAGVAAQRGGDVAVTVAPQDGDREVAQTCQDLGRGAGAQLVGVLGEGDIADVVQRLDAQCPRIQSARRAGWAWAAVRLATACTVTVRQRRLPRQRTRRVMRKAWVAWGEVQAGDGGDLQAAGLDPAVAAVVGGVGDGDGSTDAQRAEVMCVRTHGPEGAPSFPPDAAPAYAHQKPMKQTSPHLAETLRIVVS